MESAEVMAAAGLHSSSGKTAVLQDLRIMLLSDRLAGKASAADIILGREEPGPNVVTLQCVKREGEVAGWKVTLVDTQAWRDYKYLVLKTTPKVVKEEMVTSITMCPPGPHAFLLVIHEDVVFSEEMRNAVSNHVAVLGEGVWSHSLVLFITDKPLSQDKVKGRMVQWLLGKCGNRRHVLNINSNDATQVTELLEKIEKMVAGNISTHFEMDREILEAAKEKRRSQKVKAAERVKMVQKQRESSSRGNVCLPELRVVLLGYKDSGKSSSGNNILGREEFEPGQRSAVCVKKQGEVEGRRVTVVEAPGWQGCYNSVYSPAMLRREIVLSQSVCDNQGPHVFLLVVRLDEGFTEKFRKPAEGFIELLGERVWSHAMVLFTYGDWLGGMAIEEYIESEGQSLKWLVEKCENRYHVFNNQNSCDRSQVKDLLGKMEEMVAGNAGRHYEIDQTIVKQLEEKKREDDKAAEEMIMKTKKQRETVTAGMGITPLSNLRIALLGFKYAGRSATGNTILGGQEFESCSIAQCVKRQGEVYGRQITLVETPGSHFNTKHALETPKKELVLSTFLNAPGPHAFLFLLRLDIIFDEQYREVVQEYLEHLGERVWNYTLVILTFGDWLGETPVEQHIQSEGESLKWLIEKCGHRYHALDNHDRTNQSQVKELLEKIEEMVAGNDGCYYEMDRSLQREIEEKRKVERARGEHREMSVYKQHSVFKYVMGNMHLPEMCLVLLGCQRAGKTSAGNTILANDDFDLALGTAQCEQRTRKVAQRHITVIDTPGWPNDGPVGDDVTWAAQVEEMSVSPHAFLLVIGIFQSVTETMRDAIEKHLELLSERVWNHTMVLFTNGDWLEDRTIEQFIEGEGDTLRYLVEKCGNRYHVFNNLNRGDRTQVTELFRKVEEMVALNGGSYFEIKEGCANLKENCSIQKITGHLGEMELAKSIDTPPKFGDDDRSDITSMISSDYGTLESQLDSELRYTRSISMDSEPPVEHASVKSLATSSGIDSLRSAMSGGSVEHWNTDLEKKHHAESSNQQQIHTDHGILQPDI